MSLSYFQTAVLYVFLLILFGVLAYWADKKKTVVPLLFIIAAWGGIVGLRGADVGLDTANYKYLYNSGYYVWLDDIGFVKLTELISKFADSYTYMLIIASATAAFFVFGLWNLNKRINFNFTWCMIVLYTAAFLQSMNTVRQLFGISIVFFALAYLLDGKYLKYLLLIALATSMHISCVAAVSFIMVQMIFFWRKNKITTRIMVLSSIPIVFVVFAYIYLYYLSGIMKNKLEYYLGTTSRVSGLFGIFQLCTIAVMILLANQYLTPNRTETEKNIFEFISLIVLIGAIGGLIGYYYKFMDRLFAVFNIFSCVFYGMCWRVRIKNGELKYPGINSLLVALVQIFIVFYPFISNILYDWYSVMHYSLLS